MSRIKGIPGWRKGTFEERFFSKVNKNGPIPEYRPDLGPCWIWTAGLNDKGYGQFSVIASIGVVVHRYAHIVSYEIHVGPVPEGLELDHLCRVTNCVNFKHLEPVTHRENMLRGIGLASSNLAKTHCDNGHSFTEENTYYRPDNGGRQCRICNRERGVESSRTYRENNPEKRAEVLANYRRKLLQKKIKSGLSWSQFHALRQKESKATASQLVLIDDM